MAKTKCQQNTSNNSSNSGSCSLLSVTGLSSDSMSYSVSLSSTNDSNSDNSSSLSNNNSSSLTYASNSTDSTLFTQNSSASLSTAVSTSMSNEMSSSASSASSASSSCSLCSSSCNNSSNTSSSCSQCKRSNCNLNEVECENNNSVCNQLVKQYRKSKDLLRANNDIIVLLEFIKNKLIAVKPNIDLRHVQNYKIQDNINWLETFVDTLFCVLRKNDAYKAIKVKDCKVKNASDDQVSDRLYLVKAKFNNNGCIECKTVQLNFNWSRLTFNDAKSFKAILDYTITEINNEITILKSQNTQPFLQA